jgi:hypothetical protein
MVIVLALIGLLAPLAGPAHAASGPAGMESEFVARINALRASKGLGALVVDAELTGIARHWAAQMAAAGDISHNPSFGSQVQANWVKLGENVGMGPSVPSLHDAFVRSPHHYVNLVDPAFTRIGVGVVIGRNGTIFTSHQFERLASDDAAAPARAVSAPSPARAARSAAPRAAAPSPAPAAAVPAPTAAPKPVVVPARVALSLEQLRGRGL